MYRRIAYLRVTLTSWWRAFREHWWNYRFQSPSFSSVLPEVNGVSRCREKYWQILIALTAVISLPLDTHFMKNCRNKEVQPVQFLPPCAEEHVFDDWFFSSGSLGGLQCWLRARCIDECTNYHIWNHQHYNHYTYHQSESSENREFFFFPEGCMFS